MSNFQFPAFFSIINYLSSDFEKIFNKRNVLRNFVKNTEIIFTNTQNRDQFTEDLLNDSRTDILWYNNGNTFMNVLNLFKPRIFFPRYDQSMNIFINKLSLELDMYSKKNRYIDLAESSQVLLIPIYNAIQFVFHFYKNGVTVNSFIFDYFSKSKLLRFGNNLIFDSNMDNIYDIVVGTSYFNSSNTIINRKIFTRGDIKLNITIYITDDIGSIDSSFLTTSNTGEQVFNILQSISQDDNNNWSDFYIFVNKNNTTLTDYLNNFINTTHNLLDYTLIIYNYETKNQIDDDQYKYYETMIRNTLKYYIIDYTNPITRRKTNPFEGAISNPRGV